MALAVLVPASAWSQALGAVGFVGTVSVAQGGTGNASFTDGGILLGSGTGAVTATAVLPAGAVLIGDGTTDPGAQTLSGDVTMTASGAVTISNNAVESGMIADRACTSVIAGFLNPTETQATDDALNLVDNTITSNATPATALNAEDEWVAPVSMVISNLRVSDVTDPGAAGDIWQITVYDDSVATVLTCDVTNGNTECTDVANSVLVTAGEDLVVFVDSSTGSTDPAASGNMRVSFCLTPN